MAQQRKKGMLVRPVGYSLKDEGSDPSAFLHGSDPKASFSRGNWLRKTCSRITIGLMESELQAPLFGRLDGLFIWVHTGGAKGSLLS